VTFSLGKRLIIGIGRPWDWKPYYMACREPGFSVQWLCFSLNYYRVSAP
jgi:hypothetical protein